MSENKKRGLLTAFLRWSLIIVIFIGITAVGCLVAVYFYLSSDLPRISTLRDYHPPVISTVYSDDNRKIAEFYKERRILVPISAMSPMLIHAFVAAEDSRFFKHKGIDLISIFRAFFKNLEAGTIVQGGSTITQQVAKSFFLSPERNYRRKIKEAILAYRIDHSFTKAEILYLYLNQIYLGHGAYGVAAAAENYFGKTVAELDVAECALLAGLPQAPSRYSPFKYPERARQRQIYVLNRMVEEGYITPLQADESRNRKLDIHPRRNWYIEQVPYYTEFVRQYVEKKYGADFLYEEGLEIHTAVDIDMQQVAREEIEKGLRALDKRQGYRGPIKHLSGRQIESFLREQQAKLTPDHMVAGAIVKAVVTEVDNRRNIVTVRIGDTRGVIQLDDMRWARKPDPDTTYRKEAVIRHPGDALKAGDVIWVRLKQYIKKHQRWELALAQTPIAQAALLCIEEGTGKVKTMVGGRDFRESQFNRAIQSRRQPGSAFKPIIYAAALDKGYTPASVMIDSPLVFKDLQRDSTWKPKNYKNTFYGPTLFRKALTKSMNVVTVKLLKDIGIDYTIDYARKLGISSELNRDLSIALGSSGVSLLEIVTAYSVFCNMGDLIEPIFITRIEDRHGNILESNEPERQNVIEKSTAYIMTSLLEGVVKEGTGFRVKALNRPAAGKTGTTNNLHDAWFVGYTPRYITGTWVGFDDEASLGEKETGSRAASPIWLGFMKKILENDPVRFFSVPDGVVFEKIDAETGLLPIPESRKTIFECFKQGTVPSRHTKRPGSITDTEDFFKLDI